MNNQNNEDSLQQAKENLERVGAGVLAGLAMLVSVELTLEHANGDHHKASAHGHHSVSEVLARGEAKGETARLPEEFDIGLQTPNIAGV